MSALRPCRDGAEHRFRHMPAGDEDGDTTRRCGGCGQREPDRVVVTDRDPSECQHRRWSPVMNLRTGQYTGEAACWFCGVRKP